MLITLRVAVQAWKLPTWELSSPRLSLADFSSALVFPWPLLATSQAQLPHGVPAVEGCWWDETVTSGALFCHTEGMQLLRFVTMERVPQGMSLPGFITYLWDMVSGQGAASAPLPPLTQPIHVGQGHEGGGLISACGTSEMGDVSHGRQPLLMAARRLAGAICEPAQVRGAGGHRGCSARAELAGEHEGQKPWLWRGRKRGLAGGSELVGWFGRSQKGTLGNRAASTGAALEGTLGRAGCHRHF